MVVEEEETQTVPLHFRSSWTSKTFEIWAELNTTLVCSFLASFLPSNTFFSSFPSLIAPCALPIPYVSWFWKSLSSNPSHHLPFFCPPFLTTALLYSSFPQSCRSNPSSWNIHTAPQTPHSTSLPQPLCWLFTLFSQLECPYKGRGALPEQDGVSLPLVLVWQGPLRWGISRASWEPSHASSLWALLCCCTGRQELWPVLTAGRILGECYNKLDVQESTIFWGCQTWVYFPWDSISSLLFKAWRHCRSLKKNSWKNLL